MITGFFLKKTFPAILAGIIFGCLFPTYAQPSKEILTQKWSAKRIKVPGTKDDEAVVALFRKEFVLKGKPETFTIHVTGDYRYKLYVNGTFAGLGPARCSYNRQVYETLDIANYLVEGTNVLAAEVWNYGKLKPDVQNTPHCQLVVQGNTEAEKSVNSDASWTCIKSGAHTFLKPDANIPWYLGPPCEKIDFNAYPQGWQNAGFDASKWKKAELAGEVFPEGVARSGRAVIPRSIPPMTSKIERFKKALLSSGASSPPPGFPASPLPFKIPENSHLNFILDNEAITVAYPILKLSGGKNAKIKLEYFEAAYEPDASNPLNLDMRNRNKGNRNIIEGKQLVGLEDEVICDGGEHTYSTLWWRSYRYVRVVIDTQDEPLIVRDIHAIQSIYPFENKGNFNSENPEYRKILDIGRRTARVCANETFMDCAYYEQMQYVGDTRIQALVSLFEFGDDRLMRNSIEQFNESISPEGLTMSRFPTGNPQYIPGFSIWWIGMIYDYALYRNDPEFVKKMLPGAEKVISFFAGYEKEDLSLKKLPYWNYVDWHWGKNNGEPLIDERGNSALVDLQYLMALEYMHFLEEHFGSKEKTADYKHKSEKLKETITQKYFDAGKGLYADDANKTAFSQHTQALAVLADVVTGEAATKLMETVLDDPKLNPYTIYFRFYIDQALCKAKLGHKYLERLKVWKDMMEMGLTTWAETPEPTRSDCHAWGATPNIEFYRIVLGINTDAPGFSHVIIEPNLGSLTQASGKIPHPAGEISVNYQVDKKGKIEALIDLPEGVKGDFRHGAKHHHLHPGHNHVKR